ncbi:dihydrofolate reductase [Mesorhizobium sp. LHD-90]|uniref:dihydrofolate reductase n=1 Tax=Mesorhizobium sp. LHD-90 TaxID=3071414 RepID=UPI0027E0CF93|nr:dihydrofolate reductase [Mesorhizobium sp. LHD-90]MDQ6433525.1 dihydrofolate reductase [Mesorhizobium sp. LHD-90]
MRIAIYAAVAENGVIGREGGLPWRLSSDMKRFKAGTMGNPIVMGRKTWESFPKRPLPGRLNIVISRDQTYQAEGAEVVTSLKDALTLATAKGRCMAGAEEICIVGGGEIYRQAMEKADCLKLTHVFATIDGDTVFPKVDPVAWLEISSEDVPAGEKDSHATRYAVYERRGKPANDNGVPAAR